MALALPGAREESFLDQRAFCIRRTIFATVSSDRTRGTLKLDPLRQAALLAAHPRAFQAAEGAWGRRGWTHVDLAQVEHAQLAEALLLAGRLASPRPVKQRARTQAPTSARVDPRMKRSSSH